jgi:hypothetical protein
MPESDDAMLLALDASTSIFIANWFKRIQAV